jgi:hypothetical protein
MCIGGTLFTMFEQRSLTMQTLAVQLMSLIADFKTLTRPIKVELGSMIESNIILKVAAP